MARVMSLNRPEGKGALPSGKNGLFLLSTLYPDLVVPKLFMYGPLFNVNNFQGLSMLAVVLWVLTDEGNIELIITRLIITTAKLYWRKSTVIWDFFFFLSLLLLYVRCIYRLTYASKPQRFTLTAHSLENLLWQNCTTPDFWICRVPYDMLFRPRFCLIHPSGHDATPPPQILSNHTLLFFLAFQ